MRIGLIFIGLFISLGLTGQNRCGLVTYNDAFEDWMEEKIAEKQIAIANRVDETSVLQIPVVVHVIHQGEPIGTGINLSENRIKAQIDSLNADFRRLNADTINTPNTFIPIAADIKIEFVFAKQDPQGNPTNGIVRLQSSKNHYNLINDRSLIRAESFWPVEKYLNIYVLKSRPFLGYATLPLNMVVDGINDSPSYYQFEGVLVDYQYFGVNQFAPAFESYGRTLTHEVGHFLGLLHIWGDGNCAQDDFVEDTPLADNDNGGYTSPCIFPNPNDTQLCVDNEPEMFQNYMDYTDDICMNLFTKGQKMRMRTVMDNAQNRTSLTTSLGLIEPIKYANDLAAIQILNIESSLCESSFIPTLEVINYGSNEITSYDVLLFIDGNSVGNPKNVSTSLASLSLDTIVFDNQSLVDSKATITFQVNNINGVEDGNIENNSISKVISSSIQTTNFIEDFESDTLNILGTYGNTYPWEVRNAPNKLPDNKAFVFKSYNNTEWYGENTRIKTPMFNLLSRGNTYLQFSYAHATIEGDFNDGLMVKVSTDCGKTFPDILFSSFGSSLATTTFSGNYFIPENHSEWRDVIINISNYKEDNGVQFAFIGLNGNGNNIYLDDIQVVTNDIELTNTQSPLITCHDSFDVKFNVKNNGFNTISSFGVNYFMDGEATFTFFDNLNLASQDTATFSLPIRNLQEGTNILDIVLLQVNGIITEEFIQDNPLSISLLRDISEDEYPLTVDFESPDTWTIRSTQNQALFKRTSIGENGVLKAEGFENNEEGNKSWFISPKLNTGRLDSAKLYFRTSYAARNGFQDQLKVLVSVDCGQNFDSILLNANSSSLALNIVNTEWDHPISESDWQEYELDLDYSFQFGDDIRIAFVFIAGGGNNLFIDDISIRGNVLPSYQDIVRIYPNPASFNFYVGLNLPKKEPVILQLIDISGKIVFEESVENAFNQILHYKAPSQKGLYFLNIIGNEFNYIQKLIINH